MLHVCNVPYSSKLFNADMHKHRTHSIIRNRIEVIIESEWVGLLNRRNQFYDICCYCHPLSGAPFLLIYCHEPSINLYIPGRVGQSVTCLATDASLIADPGVASSILAWSHTFLEIDHEIISTVILLPSAESFKKGCCQLQAKVCARSTV